MATFSDYVKNIFWVLILLQFAPILIKGIKKQYGDLFEPKTKVGVITFKGMLSHAQNRVKEIRTFFTDTSIKAIVLKIESPGGTPGTSQTIFNEINHYKKLHPQKYVVALVENVAASGGYYVASAANYIIASPGALIGSIGAYMQVTSFKEIIDQYKVRYDFIKAGTYKGTGNPLLALTQEQKTLLQQVTDDTYRQFLRDVTSKRPQLPADTKTWADGKIFTGDQALALKLIDEVGSPSTLEKVLKEKVHIEGPIEWVKPTRRGSWASLFTDEQDETDNSFIRYGVNSICSTLEERYGSNASV
jgi:protease IV